MPKKNSKFAFLIFAGLGLYLLSTGASYAFFNYTKPVSVPTPVSEMPVKESGFRVDMNKPKTEECPLNGAMFTQEEKKIWEKRRPLGVMIENHQEARPQSGLSRADVVYEAVAEGGISRFLAVYYCGAGAKDVMVGPVRSARTYFLDFISEYADYPLYAHVGGANTPGPANALGQIGDYGWSLKNDLNQFSLGFKTFWRDQTRLGHPVATEHTVYSTTDKLFDAGADRGFTEVDKKGNAWNKNFVKWSFKDEAGVQERGTKGLEFSFWEGYKDYAVKWEYDAAGNEYKRINGGVEHVDLNEEAPIKTKVVLVALMKESRANDGYENNLHLLYGTKGQGKLLVFQDGKVVEGTWTKKDRKSRMLFKDSKGKDLKLNRGQIWIEILPLGSEVTY